MAKQTGQFPFTGRIGNVIGYKRNGIHYLRSMPADIRQTVATRKAARKFGIASSKGSLIRRAFTSHLGIRTDSARASRLNQTLIQSGLQGIKGYRFNRYAGVDNFFSVAPVLSADHILRIPAQSLYIPPNATRLEVKLIAAKIDFDNMRIISTVSRDANIDLSQPFDGLELNAALQGKGTLIVALQIRVQQHNLITFDRRYMAADLIAVELPQLLQSSRKHRKKLLKPVVRLYPVTAEDGNGWIQAEKPMPYHFTNYLQRE